MKRLFLAFAGLSLLILPSRPIVGQDIEITGNVDVGFTHSFNDPKRGSKKLPGRDFGTTQDDSFSVKLAQIHISKEAEPVGFDLKLDFFDTAQSGGISPGNSDDIAIQTANITYNADIGNGVTITAGKMETLIGRDVIESKNNWFASHGLIFTRVPLTHTGVRATYPLMDNLTFTFGLNNGADTEVDAGHGKSIEAQLDYAFSEELNIKLGINYGEEGNNDATASPEGDKVFVVNLVSTYDVTEDLSAYFEFLIRTEDQALARNLGTGALIANSRLEDRTIWGSGFGVQYRMSDRYGVSARYEYLSDERSKTPGTAHTAYWDVTLTGHCWLTEDLELRMEFRHDDSNRNIYGDDSAAGSDDTNNTLGLLLLYNF